jgi:hypothetical protein
VIGDDPNDPAGDALGMLTHRVDTPELHAELRRDVERCALLIERQRAVILALLLLAQRRPVATMHEIRARCCPTCGHTWYRHEGMGHCVQPVEVRIDGKAAVGFARCGCPEQRP